MEHPKDVERRVYERFLISFDRYLEIAKDKGAGSEGSEGNSTLQT